MNDMFHTTKYLFIISTIAGLLLAITEYITAPKITENKIKVLENAIKEVLPNATKFEKLKINDLSFTLGFDNSGKYVGVAQTVAPKGYAGPIEMVVGIGQDSKISGVKIQSMKETPGLGTKLNGDFLKKFLALAKLNSNPKYYVQKDGGDVEAITGATISSRAFCTGIRQAIKNYQDYKEQIEAKVLLLTNTQNLKQNNTPYSIMEDSSQHNEYNNSYQNKLIPNTSEFQIQDQSNINQSSTIHGDGLFKPNGNNNSNTLNQAINKDSTAIKNASNNTNNELDKVDNTTYASPSSK